MVESSLRHGPGIIALVALAREPGLDTVYLPAIDAPEATLDLLAYLDPTGEWPCLRTVIQVEAERRIAGVVTSDTRYVLASSRDPHPRSSKEVRVSLEGPVLGSVSPEWPFQGVLVRPCTGANTENAVAVTTP